VVDGVVTATFPSNRQTVAPNGQTKEASDDTLNARTDAPNRLVGNKNKIKDVSMASVVKPTVIASSKTLPFPQKEGAKTTPSSNAVKTFLDHSDMKLLDSVGKGNSSHTPRATNQSPRLLFDGACSLQMSYDEQRLRRELTSSEGQGGEAVVPGAPVGRRSELGRPLSRSDFWGTLSDSVEASLDDKDVMVAELSGEQTSL